eukprot:364988-Chlamydomonas_euryale.AAC.26
MVVQNWFGGGSSGGNGGGGGGGGNDGGGGGGGSGNGGGWVMLCCACGAYFSKRTVAPFLKACPIRAASTPAASLVQHHQPHEVQV